MENTAGVLFGANGKAEWFVALGERSVGPLTARDVYEKIQLGELTWAHYIWRQGAKDWQRVCDVEAFASVLPEKPTHRKPEPTRKPEESSQKDIELFLPEERIWFLYFNESQSGPYSHAEVARLLRIGKIHGKVYGWRDGMSGWEKLEKLVVFGEDIQESIRVREELGTGRAGGMPDRTGFVERRATPRPKDLRAAPRRPLLARILVVGEDDGQVSVAMCRDVSVGGMQVLTDRIPGSVGSRIRLNVSPAGAEARIRPFAAQGVIVRILEDGLGFSFRFERLRGEARRAIEEYVEAEFAEMRRTDESPQP